jgi:hypothetical protein
MIEEITRTWAVEGHEVVPHAEAAIEAKPPRDISSASIEVLNFSNVINRLTGGI